MSGNTKWLVKIGLAFTAISGVIYYLFYLLFHDSEFIFHHFTIDLAFLPIEVFLVAAIFENLMGRREKEARLERMHMIIGAFFSEAGMDLVSFLAVNSNIQNLNQDLKMIKCLSKPDFARVKLELEKIMPEVYIDEAQLAELKRLLYDKREYFLRLMENNSLMESEDFAQLLLAVFHLYQELQLRPDLDKLQPSDWEHLSMDVRRVYLLLTDQWIDYLYHIKVSTPYLFSLAVRTNPFDPEASIEVKDSPITSG